MGPSTFGQPCPHATLSGEASLALLRRPRKGRVGLGMATQAKEVTFSDTLGLNHGDTLSKLCILSMSYLTKIDQCKEIGVYRGTES